MPKFALFDPTAEKPQPVTGWYDTDTFSYTNLPSKESLAPVDPITWSQRLDAPDEYVVVGNRVQRKESQQ